MAVSQGRLEAKHAARPSGPRDSIQTTLTPILGRQTLGTDSAYSVLQGIFFC